MDYRPISSRTRSKRETALMERYWEMKINSGVSPARSKKMRRSNQASVSHMSESSSRKQSIEWVADHVEQTDDDSEGFYSQESSGKQGKGEGVAVGVKRKRSLGLDDSNKGGCNWRAVSDNGAEVVDLLDSDDDEEVVVSKGKEGGGGVDVDDVSDGGSNEDVDDVSDNGSDEAVSSADEEDSSDESEFLPGKESTVEENDEECVSFSDEDSCEEGNEEESEVTEKNEREVDELFDEYKFAMACDENASTESKAKGNDDARSKNRIHDFDDETHGGTSESGFDKGSKLDVQRARKTGVEAEGNNFSESINSRREGNDETSGGSRPELYKEKERVRELTNKKGITAPKDCNAFMILVDSIYDKGEVSGEQLPPSNDESPQDEAPRDEPLPKFFRLGHPPSPAPEKSASEIELEELFEQYDSVVMSEGIGSTDSIGVEINDSIPPGKEVTQHMHCSQGKHDLILDEEIGYICRFCPHVHQEIKYIVPDFAPNPYGKAGKRFYEEDNRTILDDLQCNDPDDSGFSSHAHTEGTVWDLIPGVESDMYPHQREGFEFIWRRLAGGIQLGKLEKPTAYGGDGCIIAHAPGTGKTRLTMIFIQSYMIFNPSSRPLIVAPRTMLLTWEEEFKKWGFDIPLLEKTHSGTKSVCLQKLRIRPLKNYETKPFCG